MKFLLYVFLVAISCQVILCDDVNLARMINGGIPLILQAGVAEGKLPGGPYYVHDVIKSSIGAEETRVTLDVRQLDNQTLVTVKATIDNEKYFSVKSSCFTSKIGKNVMASTQGWPFSMLAYQPNCRNDPSSHSDIQWEDYPYDWYDISAEQLAGDNAIKSTYEHLEEAKKGQFKGIMDNLDPKIPPGPFNLGVGGDYFCVSQTVGQDRYGEYEYYLLSIYQPCTGDRKLAYDVRDLNA